jgi:hypothetical protein
MDPLNENPSLLDRIERFAADHVDPDPLIQARFLSLVSALIEAGRAVESRLSDTDDLRYFH